MKPGVAFDVDIRNYESVLGEAGAADLVECLETVASVPGDIVECGSWRGGSAMFMADFMHRHGIEKRIFACDSYEGFDLPELQAERALGLTQEADDAFASTSLKYVEAKIRQRGLTDVIVPVKGYFEATLPLLRGPLSLIFIDCDLSRSALFAAETLWRHVPPGGLVVFDDYDNGVEFRGIRLAVNRFVADRGADIGEHGPMRRLYRVARGLQR